LLCEPFRRARLASEIHGHLPCGRCRYCRLSSPPRSRGADIITRTNTEMDMLERSLALGAFVVSAIKKSTGALREWIAEYIVHVEAQSPREHQRRGVCTLAAGFSAADTAAAVVTAGVPLWRERNDQVNGVRESTSKHADHALILDSCQRASFPLTVWEPFTFCLSHATKRVRKRRPR
jgi:hypothetical protein